MPLTLPIQKRPSGIKPPKLRAQKKIPAVVYGSGIQNQHFVMDYEVFRKTFEKASYSVLVTLEEGEAKIPSLIHEIQYDPVTDNIVHVDFYAVRMDKKVKTHIPFEFVGVSEAVKLGAVLNVVKHDLHVSCLPKDLVRKIPVDISVLQKIGDAVHVRDVKIPSGIESLNPPEEQVVSAIAVRIVEEEVAPVAEAVPVEGAVSGAEGAAPVAEGEKSATAPATGSEKGKAEGQKIDSKKGSVPTTAGKQTTEPAGNKAKGKEKK